MSSVRQLFNCFFGPWLWVRSPKDVSRTRRPRSHGAPEFMASAPAKNLRTQSKEYVSQRHNSLQGNHIGVTRDSS